MTMALGMEREVPGSPQREPTELRTLEGKAQSCRPGIQVAGGRGKGAQAVHSLGRGRSNECGAVYLPQSNVSIVSECSPVNVWNFNDPEKNHESHV